MLTELLSELETRKKGCEADFWATFRKLAAGEKVAPAAVERLLADSGRTQADLKAGVELMQHRRQWSELMAGAAALEQEQVAIRRRIAAEHRTMQEAEWAHTDATVPLQARPGAIKTALRAAGDARQRLMDSCPYADLKAALAKLTERIAALRTRAYELRRQADECVTAAKSDLEQAEVFHASDAALWRERSERHRRQAEAARTELPGVEQEIAKLKREEAGLRERMVAPLRAVDTSRSIGWRRAVGPVFRFRR